MNHRKIAEIAHVSTSTVSKALSGSREVSAEVAEQIRQIALDIGYFSEKNRRKFINKRKREAHIAVICPEIVSIHYSRIVTLLKSFIEERGGRISVYISDFDINKTSNIIEYLSMNKEIDGIILLSCINTVSTHSLPIVSFDIYNSECNHDTIGADIEMAIYDIVDYLSEIGHKKIGFIGETHTVSKQRMFVKALSKKGLEINKDYIYNIDSRFEEIGHEAAKMIISSDNHPTAFIAAYDEIAVSLIHDFEKAGISVPEDISVFGMNDIPLAPYIKSSLSTVRFFYDEQAALTVDILYDKIFGTSNKIQRLIVNHELIIRDSTGKPKEKQ